MNWGMLMRALKRTYSTLLCLEIAKNFEEAMLMLGVRHADTEMLGVRHADTEMLGVRRADTEMLGVRHAAQTLCTYSASPCLAIGKIQCRGYLCKLNPRRI